MTDAKRPSSTGAERAAISEPDTRKTKQVLVRLDSDDYYRVLAQAHEAGISPAHLFRLCWRLVTVKSDMEKESA